MPEKKNDGRGTETAPVANQLRADSNEATAAADTAAALYVTGPRARHWLSKERDEAGDADPTIIAEAYLSSYLSTDGYDIYMAAVTEHGLVLAATFDEAAAIPVAALPGITDTRAEVAADSAKRGLRDPHDVVRDARAAKERADREKAERERAKAAQADPVAAARLRFSGPPIPLRSRALPDFPVDALPGTYRDYVRALAWFTQTDPAVASMILLGTIATAVQRCVDVEARPGWREPLCFYTVVIAEPGERKSAVVDSITKPLNLAERTLDERSAADRAKAMTRQDIARRRLESARKDAAKDRTMEQLALNLTQELEEIEIPIRPLLWADDITSEALVSRLADCGERVGVISAEGGILKTILGRYSNDVPNLDVWLKGYSGDSLRVERVGRSAEQLDRPAVSLAVTLQSVVVEKAIANDLFRGSGLAARIAFVRPPSMLGRRESSPAPVDARLEAEFIRGIDELAQRMTESHLPGDPFTTPDKRPGAAVLTLDPLARDRVVKLQNAIEPRLNPKGGDLAAAGMAEWGGKHVGRVVRVAALLHLAEHGPSGVDLPVTADTLDHATAIGEYMLAHATDVLGGADTGGDLPDAELILDHLRKIAEKRDGYTFRRNELLQNLPTRLRKSGAAHPALALLERYGYVVVEEIKPLGGGRKRVEITINPDMRPGGAP
ncbi:DUF3987 domain-containing protein [Rhodococcus hoagii]|nr:DUF3987 domain-containing protein [Prescottella equi]